MLTLTRQSLSIVLRSPELGDVFQLDLRTQFYRALRGDFWTYVQPPIYRLNMDFRILERAKVLEFEQFLLTNRADQIVLNDPLIGDWVGNITNQPFNVQHAGRNSNPINVVFEGVRA